MTHTEYGIEMYVDVPDEHWLTLETGCVTLSYAQAAREMYQEEFPSKTVRVVKKTSTFEVVERSFGGPSSGSSDSMEVADGPPEERQGRSPCGCLYEHTTDGRWITVEPCYGHGRRT